MPRARDLLTAAAALAVLPFALASIGLGVTSATEVVVFAIACMALNILVATPASPRSATAPGSGWPPMGRD